MKKIILIAVGIAFHLSTFAQNSSKSTITFNQYAGLSTSDKKELRDTYHQLHEKNFHRFDLISSSEKTKLSSGQLNNLARQRAQIVKDYLLSEQGLDEQNVFLKFSGPYPTLWMHKPEGYLTASGKVQLNEADKQCYSYNSSSTNTIYTDNGNTLYFGPYAFVDQNGNQITSSNVNICLWEFKDKRSLVQSNLTTSSNSQMIETGGSFFIEAYVDGKKLKMAPGQSYSINIQTDQRFDDMFTYYGSNQNGFVDWDVDKTKPAILTTGDINAIEVQEQQQIQSLNNEDINYNQNRANVIDNVWLGETEGYEPDPVNFYELSSGQLGWINCDRFYDVQNKATLAVRVNTTDQLVVRLVFRNINSVMPAYNNSNYKDRYEASGIPVGEKVLVLAYSVNDDGAMLGYKEITIGENEIEDIDVDAITKSRFNGALSDLVY